ncbi:MAG: acylphosphatase [Myxococcota bacterium]
MEKKAVKFRVYGIVQGVSYRYSALKEAKHLNIGGWIRNLSDGSVEGYAEGELESVDKFISWCRKGPYLAKVEKFVLEEVEPLNYTDFEIRY